MNRSLNRANPDILIAMIAVKQIMRGGDEDKRMEEMGPQKPATEMSGTAPKSNLLPSLSLSLSVYLLVFSRVGLFSLFLSLLKS